MPSGSTLGSKTPVPLANTGDQVPPESGVPAKLLNKSTILDGRIPHSVILELFTEHGIGTQITSN